VARARAVLSRYLPVVLATVAAGAPAAAAAAAEPCVAAPRASLERRAWPAPLDRSLTLDARNLSLRAALDRLSAAARLRLSYTSEYLPLDRRVCDRFDGTTAGDALVALLRGTALEPVVSGADQVVLAPRPSAIGAAQPERRRVGMLERVVVTGSASGTPRARTVGVDVIERPEVATHDGSRLHRLLDGAVPGIWLWEQSPSTVLARYGSIRGASSFAVSHPKIYLDGIEVANPLLVTDLGPGAISHIEVIRGPQGAALYGTDAISGVINVVSRHDGVGPDGRRLQLRGRVGLSESDFAARGVLTQEHALAVRAGSSARSAGLAASVGTIGAYLPNGQSHRLAANGDARLVGARGTITATARLFAQQSGAADNPLLVALPRPGSDGEPFAARDSSPPQSARQYTLGATGTLSAGSVWTHRATVGIDGYRLRHLDLQLGSFASSADSALRAARGGADRTTVRLSSVALLGDERGLATTLTVAAEHSALRESSGAAVTSMPFAPAAPADPVRWRRNTGLTAQVQLGFRDALFATAGGRVERSSGYVRESQLSLLPMLGAAWVRDLGATTIKLRTAYGEGIRPVRAPLRAWTTMRSDDASVLAPERQSGIEGGLDLTVGRAFGLHVTRFDQRASGLVQSVAVPSTATSAPGAARQRIGTQLQNVGEIANRGWELQARGVGGPLGVAATLSLVDSRVARVMSGYAGELRAGDRMLEVPSRTASLSATWSATRWQAALGLSRASDWINYDRTRLGRDLAAGDPHALLGARLRDYWRTYDGVTRLRASLSRALVRDLSAVVVGDNLLGDQRGEPDDVTVVPGRTVMAGMQVRF